MLEQFKKHSVLYALLLACAYLVWFFPLWLADTWSMFSQDPLAQWLANRRWSGMSPYLSAGLLVVATASILGLLWIILRAVRQHRREVGWLETIADEDSRDMSERLWHTISRIQTPMPLHLSEPYVDLRINLLNTTVYTLTFVGVEGHLTYHGHSLQRQPELVHKNYELAHTKYRPLVLRQWLQPTTAQQIIAEGKVEFGSKHFAVWFIYQDRHGITQQVRKGIPEESFTEAVELPPPPSNTS
jgi:hypothetical protein